MTYLLDTNIIIHLIRKSTLGLDVDRAYSLTASRTRNLISVVSVGELLSFATRRNWGAGKISALEDALGELLWIDINDRAVLESYAQIEAFTLSSGRKLGQNDLWIAASTAVTGSTLLTTDRDFDHLNDSKLQRIWIDPNQGKTP